MARLCLSMIYVVVVLRFSTLFWGILFSTCSSSSSQYLAQCLPNGRGHRPPRQVICGFAPSCASAVFHCQTIHSWVRQLPFGRAPQSKLPIAGRVLVPLLRMSVAGSRPRYRERTNLGREQDEPSACRLSKFSPRKPGEGGRRLLELRRGLLRPDPKSP